MRIVAIECPSTIEEKLEAKHQVTLVEVGQVLLSRPRIRFVEKGHVEDENVYAAFGRTFGGRFLAVFFIYKPPEQLALIISARDMSNKERKAYGRK